MSKEGKEQLTLSLAGFAIGFGLCGTMTKAPMHPCFKDGFNNGVQTTVTLYRAHIATNTLPIIQSQAWDLYYHQGVPEEDRKLNK